MAKRTTSYRSNLLQSLTVPQEAASYLNAALEDSAEMFLDALKDVAQAHQMARVAREAGVARESLYRSLSNEGNPTLEMLSSVLKALKLRISIAEKSPLAVPVHKRRLGPVHSRRKHQHPGRAAAQSGTFSQLSLFGNPSGTEGVAASLIAKAAVESKRTGAGDVFDWQRTSRLQIADEPSVLPGFNPQLATAATHSFTHAGQ